MSHSVLNNTTGSLLRRISYLDFVFFASSSLFRRVRRKFVRNDERCENKRRWIWIRIRHQIRGDTRTEITLMCALPQHSNETNIFKLNNNNNDDDCLWNFPFRFNFEAFIGRAVYCVNSLFLLETVGSDGGRCDTVFGTQCLGAMTANGFHWWELLLRSKRWFPLKLFDVLFGALCLTEMTTLNRNICCN